MRSLDRRISWLLSGGKVDRGRAPYSILWDGSSESCVDGKWGKKHKD